jgi:hypothetical protein
VKTLNTADKEPRQWILPCYRAVEFTGQNTLAAAIEFCELLRRADADVSEEEVFIVPAEHVHDIGGGLGKRPMVCYEAFGQLAEAIQLGHSPVGHLYRKMQAIEKKHSVMFECYNSWSTSVVEQD